VTDIVVEPEPAAQAEALFRRSVLKQQKLAAIVSMLGATDGLRCLDLGSDNGIVSLLLRRRGGRWASADLTAEAVAAIGSLVGGEVTLVDGRRMPYADAEFDRVVVVDMLEHVADDQAFVDELARITRPGGVVVVNTPHFKDTWLRKVRHAVGLTDEKHGHLRPGYDAAMLRRLFAANFELQRSRTYSRFFSEAIDTALNYAIERLGKKSSAKGMVVTGADLKKHRRLFWMYSLVYPFVWMVSRLDGLIPWASGYMLIAAGRRTSAAAKTSASA
jgi:ubiquinone/menaquinone biosynthesis C-methylase UbiE